MRPVLGALLGVVILLLPSACRRVDRVVDTLRVEWTLTPTAPVVNGDSAVEIVLHHPDGAAVLDAALDLEGHMTHPGMAPVIAPLVAAGDGRYRVDVAFTMSGDWVLFVSGRLDDGRVVRQRIGELVVRSAG